MLYAVSGVDVSANQAVDEIEDTEIFQMEFNKTSGSWALRTAKNKYWHLSDAGTVKAASQET